MLRAVALRFESGAMTCVSTPSISDRARRRAWRPSAPIPSSLVSRTRIRCDSRGGRTRQSARGFRGRDPHRRPLNARRRALREAGECPSGGARRRRAALSGVSAPPALQRGCPGHHVGRRRDRLRAAGRSTRRPAPGAPRFAPCRLACCRVSSVCRPYGYGRVRRRTRASRATRASASHGDHVRRGRVASVPPPTDLRRARRARVADPSHPAGRRDRRASSYTGPVKPIRRGLVSFVAIVVAAFAALPASAWGAYPGANGMLAYTGVVDQSWDSEIYTISATGGAPTQLTENHANGAASWSADGRRIAYVHWGPPVGGVWVMRSDGTSSRTCSAPTSTRSAQRAEIAGRSPTTAT